MLPINRKVGLAENDDARRDEGIDFQDEYFL